MTYTPETQFVTIPADDFEVFIGGLLTLVIDLDKAIAFEPDEDDLDALHLQAHSLLNVAQNFKESPDG